MIVSCRSLKFTAALLLCAASRSHADDGYRLWLRYQPLSTSLRHRYAAQTTEVVIEAQGPAVDSARSELERALPRMIGVKVPIHSQVDRDGALVLARADLQSITQLQLGTANLGSEGFLIRSARVNGHRAILIIGGGNAGLLYGTFALLRRLQMHRPLVGVDERERPALPLRVLDHWDNLDRSVERGYAGKSLWDWKALPSTWNSRYADYARANASVGINGAVLNNVNADPRVLETEYLGKVAALADLLRPYAMRVYLSVRFSSPINVGGLSTADPADAKVQAWWRAKADEIYRLIPDFGGFVVKANSEGQPGPQDYHRSHAEGANVIARALRPHGGTIFWRTFVYGAARGDRATQAYDEFRPLDGAFDDNVILQVKNGPVDFQPREPFHPLFGQMPHTRVALEVQITREYLGQNTGIAYLGPMWTEVLSSDTCAPQCGAPVSSVITAMAGVANVGTDRNWTGTIFDQSNWYAFGRLAWDPRLSAKTIAAEWIRQTWVDDRRAVQTISTMMMASREAAVDFMTPLGLAHQMATDHHYGPAPWVCDLKQPSWNPCYYNRANTQGIGFDRVNAPAKSVAEVPAGPAIHQYMPPVADRFAREERVTDAYLLWFHHLSWSYRMRSGLTLWEELVRAYDRGVASVGHMTSDWDEVRPFVDRGRWISVASDLKREQREARWWRDASISYFQNLSRLPLPKSARRPAHPLDFYKSLKPPGLPGER